MNGKGFSRLLAAGIAVSYFGTQTLFAHVPESSFWAERRRSRNRPASVSLASASLRVSEGAKGLDPWAVLPLAASVALASSPPAFVTEGLPPSFLIRHRGLLSSLSNGFGSIRKVSLPSKGAPSAPIVLHIQDIHLNAEAQLNISRTVQDLLSHGRVGGVALEGGFAPLGLNPFRTYPNRKAIGLAADFLLKNGEISGPVHGAVLARTSVPLVGVDDPIHYRLNVEAYRRSESRAADMKAILAGLRVELEAEKATVFHSSLKAFDQAVQRFRERNGSLSDYVRAIAAARGGQVPTSIEKYLSALVLEESLDFQKVERERGEVIDRLVRVLSPDELEELSQRSASYRLARTRYGEFYGYVRDLCGKHGVAFSRYPALDRYVRYVLEADRIDAEDLYRDLERSESEIYGSLTTSSRERFLVRQSRRLSLQTKLVDFSLSPAEWEDYRALSAGEGSLDLKLFENFYIEAQARDEAMARNLLSAQGTAGAPVFLLVTGGFHSPGLTRRLTEAGCAVIRFVPRIDSVQGTPALSVFTREKTPLDKLFSGEKLFLAPPPIAATALPAAAAAVNAAEEIANGPADFADEKKVNHTFGLPVDAQTAADKSAGAADVGLSKEGLALGTVSFRLQPDGLQSDALIPGKRSWLGTLGEKLRVPLTALWLQWPYRWRMRFDPRLWEVLRNGAKEGNLAFEFREGNVFVHPRERAAGHDLFKSLKELFKEERQINGGFDSAKDTEGNPEPTHFITIEEDGNLVDYAVFDPQGGVGVRHNPTPENLRGASMVAIQNTDRAKRPGLGGAGPSVADARTPRRKAEENPAMYVLQPDYIKDHFGKEMWLRWRSQGDRVWWFTCNPFPIWPYDSTHGPLDQFYHAIFSRGDGNVPQTFMDSKEAIRDVLEALGEINASDDLQGKEGVRGAINGWFYGDHFKAGASQNQAHAHFLRFPFPLERAPTREVGRAGTVTVSVVDDGLGTGLVLEADENHKDALALQAHLAVQAITAKGHSFNLLLVPTNGRIRIFVADKIAGVPKKGEEVDPLVPKNFENEWAFSEFGRAYVIDDPSRFYLLDHAQFSVLADGANNPAALVKGWKADGRAAVDPTLGARIRLAVQSIHAPPEEVEELALTLVRSWEEPGRSNGRLNDLGPVALGLAFLWWVQPALGALALFSAVLWTDPGARRFFKKMVVPLSGIFVALLLTVLIWRGRGEAGALSSLLAVTAGPLWDSGALPPGHRPPKTLSDVLAGLPEETPARTFLTAIFGEVSECQVDVVPEEQWAGWVARVHLADVPEKEQILTPLQSFQREMGTLIGKGKVATVLDLFVNDQGWVAGISPVVEGRREWLYMDLLDFHFPMGRWRKGGSPQIFQNSWDDIFPVAISSRNQLMKIGRRKFSGSQYVEVLLENSSGPNVRLVSLMNSADRRGPEKGAGRLSDFMEYLFPVFPGVFAPATWDFRVQYMDLVYYRALRATEDRLFNWPQGAGSRTLVLGAGSGFDSLIAARHTAGEIWAADINPLALENTRYVFRLHGMEHRLRTFQLNNAADSEGKLWLVWGPQGQPLARKNGDPEGDPVKFDLVLWNMPSYSKTEASLDPQNRAPSELFDGAGYSVLRTLANALPRLLKPGASALLWNMEQTDGMGNPIVESALATAGNYDPNAGFPLIKGGVHPAPRVMEVRVRTDAKMDTNLFVVRHPPGYSEGPEPGLAMDRGGESSASDQVSVVAKALASLIERRRGNRPAAAEEIKAILAGRELLLGLGEEHLRGRLEDRLWLDSLRKGTGPLGLDFPTARRLLLEGFWSARSLNFGEAVPAGRVQDRRLDILLLTKENAGNLPSLIGEWSRINGRGENEMTVMALDPEARRAADSWREQRNGSERVRWVDASSSVIRDSQGLRMALSAVERSVPADLRARHFTGCVLLVPPALEIDWNGSASGLFENALVFILDQLKAVPVQKGDLKQIDRLARAISSAA
ncbi:MAG: hypothetical protein IPP35_04405 [Elusimicrobia bacterium]|nr:hypothetical protein [Elusimicrobiota bacterium]